MEEVEAVSSTTSPVCEASTLYTHIRVGYVWTVNNFSNLKQTNGQYIESPIFTDTENTGTKWLLRLHPNGLNEDSLEYISLYVLMVECRCETVVAHFAFGVLTDHRIRPIFAKSIASKKEYAFKLGKDWGYSKFGNKVKVMNDWLVGDTLTIFCDIQFKIHNNMNRLSDYDIEKRHQTLSQQMVSLLNSTDKDIIRLAVDGHEFRAHKSLLKARSPVFAAMFAHDMEESKDNRVVIEDISKEVFEQVMRFVYTADIDYKNANYKQLLIASDKYDLKELKHICEKYLSSQLTTETVCDLLLMAEFYSAEELKADAIEFIRKNLKAVKKTEEWKSVRDKLDLCQCYSEELGLANLLDDLAQMNISQLKL